MQHKVIDKACDSPMDACIMVGPMAEYYLENKIGRQITLEEAMKIISESHEAGLVTQTQSVTRPFMICNCCKCCCGFLGAVRRTPFPAKLVVSNHLTNVDPEKCTGCEDCIENCQVQAIAMNDDGVAQIDYDRCIGCGLCISTCPEDALSLILKPADQLSVPKESLHDQMARGGKRRRGDTFDDKDVVDYGFD
jgi:ferredoxin